MVEDSDSTTYLAVLREAMAEGMAQGAKETLLRLGRKRFGAPGPALEAKIEALTELERLEELTDRLLEVSSWDELIAGS
jgi:hypothetical protein